MPQDRLSSFILFPHLEFTHWKKQELDRIKSIAAQNQNRLSARIVDKKVLRSMIIESLSFAMPLSEDDFWNLKSKRNDFGVETVKKSSRNPSRELKNIIG